MFDSSLRHHDQKAPFGHREGLFFRNCHVTRNQLRAQSLWRCKLCPLFNVKVGLVASTWLIEMLREFALLAHLRFRQETLLAFSMQGVDISQYTLNEFDNLT